MAGINVPQYEIFKISTDKLKYSDWDLNITKEEALKYQELISLFECQAFRMIANNIIGKESKYLDYSKLFLQVIISKKSHFARATSNKGITVNGVKFKRIVGTNGGIKNNTLVFCNAQYIDELNNLCECNRNTTIPLVPAKYESYKALTWSASQPICEPNGILVVSDAMTSYNADVIELSSCEDSPTGTPIVRYIKDKQFDDVNASDGFNLCTISYMERVSESLGLDYTATGVCLRNAWLKGMMYPFPIVEFVEKYNNGNYIVKDIWGYEHDIRNIDLILTESSLKLWKAYSSIYDYIDAYRENGYCFSVTKICSPHLDEQRELNYQYLQSYDFTDEDIEELCKPTVDYLKNSMGGDYESVINFLGISENTDDNCWQRALYESEYMLGDSYIVDSIHRYIKKRIDDSKIGKLKVDGNYQLASGDPITLMQHICGIKRSGLLKAGEVYSKFWIDKNENEVVVFRSPMTSHNNILKMKVNNSKEAQYWYQYMSSIFILNSFDCSCAALNGADYDGDLIYSTNNSVLKRRHITLPAIECAQNSSEKIFINEDEIKKTNKNGMGNKVGTITNRVTAMMEVQSRFEKGSKEWNELAYRITCGQTYQQNEIDRVKGIVSTPMPLSWYNIQACGDDRFLQSICADKKPYFFTYVYEYVMRDYKKYIKVNEKTCLSDYSCSINDLYNKDVLTDEEKDFLFWYELKFPVGMGDCAMNRICKYMESQLDSFKSELKNNSNFDYNLLKVKRRCTSEHKEKLKELEVYYCECLKNLKHKYTIENSSKYENITSHMKLLGEKINKMAIEICPNEDERLNIVLDMVYKDNRNTHFMWDTIGYLIINRLKSEDFKDVICS